MTYVPTPRKRVPVYEAIHYNLDGMTLKEAAEYLATLALDKPEAKLDYGDRESYVDQHGLYVRSHRDETDGEMASRHASEKHYRELAEKRDAAEFARLSAKFAEKS